MKKLIVVFMGCLVSFAGCKTSTGPATPAIPAVMPQNGSTFTYAYSGTNPAVQLTEHVTITDTTGSEFYASLVSDTVSGFSTTSIDTFIVLTDGDLKPVMWCCCDTLRLPIGSHLSFTPSPDSGEEIPTKFKGIVDPNSSVIWHTQYEDEETLNAAGTNFQCTQVSETITIIAEGPQGVPDTSLIIDRYWYSATLGYFVKEEQEHSNDGAPLSVDWTRILTAYKK
jgi:hypothetical protein